MTAPAKTSDELKYWVSFARIPGVGRVRFQTMLNHFGGMSEAWRAGSGALRDAGLDRRTRSAILAERAKIVAVVQPSAALDDAPGKIAGPAPERQYGAIELDLGARHLARDILYLFMIGEQQWILGRGRLGAPTDPLSQSLPDLSHLAT